MGGIPYEKLPHSCGTRNGLQVFMQEDGTVDGYCFSCGTRVSDPYGPNVDLDSLPKPKVKTPEEIQEEIDEISELKAIDLPNRKLKKAALEFFGITVGLSEEDGETPTTIYYPYHKNGKLTGYKVRGIKYKSFWTVGDQKEVDLFGWEQAKKSQSSRLIITEGENDAAAVLTIYKKHQPTQHKHLIPAVVSLPHGVASAGPDLDRMKKEINKRFKEVIFCFDDDEPGNTAVEKAMLIFPEAKSVTLPAKDANECLTKGLSLEAHKALTWGAVKPKNSRLIFGNDIHEEAKEQARYGELSWPWDTLNAATRGIRLGETIYIGGGVKMGKSDVLNSLAAHFIKEHQAPVLLVKPEESNKKTYKLLAGKITGKVFHDPNVPFDKESYDEAGKVLDNKVAMVNLYQNLSWDNLKDDIISAAHWGAKAVFIDPITNLTNGMSASETNERLAGIAQDLAKMALDLNIVVFIFCHLKAHEGNISQEKRLSFYREGKFIGLGNCPHEKGGDVLSTQFAGSRAMMRSCNMMLGYEGNKDEAIPEESRNMRHLRLIEDREFGEVVTCPLYWNPNTTQLREVS